MLLALTNTGQDCVVMSSTLAVTYLLSNYFTVRVSPCRKAKSTLCMSN